MSSSASHKAFLDSKSPSAPFRWSPSSKWGLPHEDYSTWKMSSISPSKHQNRLVLPWQHTVLIELRTYWPWGVAGTVYLYYYWLELPMKLLLLLCPSFLLLLNLAQLKACLTILVASKCDCKPYHGTEICGNERGSSDLTGTWARFWVLISRGPQYLCSPPPDLQHCCDDCIGS